MVKLTIFALDLVAWLSSCHFISNKAHAKGRSHEKVYSYHFVQMQRDRFQWYHNVYTVGNYACSSNQVTKSSQVFISMWCSRSLKKPLIIMIKDKASLLDKILETKSCYSAAQVCIFGLCLSVRKKIIPRRNWNWKLIKRRVELVKKHSGFIRDVA